MVVSTGSSLLACVKVRLLAVDREVEGGGGCFLCKTGLNAVGSVCLAELGRGACFDAARAYDGVFGRELGVLKLNPLDGRDAACLMIARSLAILSSFASMSSGTLHPKVFAPARALLIRWSSLSLMKGC